MSRRGGGAARLAAFVLALVVAACEAPGEPADTDAADADAGEADAGGTGAAAPAAESATSGILGLSADELLVEVEGGSGRLAIVRRRPAPEVAVSDPAAPAPGDSPGDTAAADEEAAEAAEAEESARQRALRDRETDRQEAGARRELGLALERVGDIAGAVSELEAALAAAPWAGLPAETPLGDLARICRRGEPAEPVARACARAFASSRFAPAEMADLVALRGDANARLGRTQRALSDYATALEIDSSHARALLGRAWVHIRAGQPARALNGLRLAIETGPRPVEARLARAAAYMALGRFEGAVADYDAVLANVAAAPWEPAAWRGRAWAHCAMGRAEAAAVDWRLWADSVPGGAGYLQEMLRARGHLRAPWRAGIDPVIRDALAAWTRAGCP